MRKTIEHSDAKTYILSMDMESSKKRVAVGLSGGVDSNALHKPKRFFGAARNMREGGSLTIGFNSRYLLDALHACRDDEVMLELNQPTSPCLVKPLEGDAYLYLILPVRLKA